MDKISHPPTNWSSVFNTPLECGLRASILLTEAFPQKLDLQRIVQYDYLIVHSGDVENGPESIHPPTPHRSGELLIRRPLIEQGLNLMQEREIVEIEFSPEGILYSAGPWAITFLNSLHSKYTSQLKNTSKWVIKHFSTFSDQDLIDFTRKNWSNWGAEFEFESLFRRTSL